MESRRLGEPDLRPFYLTRYLQVTNVPVPLQSWSSIPLNLTQAVSSQTVLFM